MPEYTQPGSAENAFQSQAVSLGNPAFSTTLDQFASGGGGFSSGQPQAPQDDRPYSATGKLRLNMLDFQSAGREQPGLAQTGGLFTGLFGALGGALGDQGRQAGEGLGHFLEMPLGLLGDVMGGVGSIGLQVSQPGPNDWNPSFADINPINTEGKLTIGSITQSVLGAFGVLGQVVQRAYAGSEFRGPMPDDLQQAVQAGTMTREQAADQLVARGIGYTDNTWANIGLSVLLDPLTWLSLGVGGVAKGAAGVEKVASGLEAAGKLEKGGRLTAAMARAALEAGDTPITRLGRLEAMGLHTFGRASTLTPDSAFVQVANQVTRITDPLRIFGGGDIGKRTADHVMAAATDGVLATYKPGVYSAIRAGFEKVAPGAGQKLDHAMGVAVTNLTLRWIADEYVSGALKTAGKAEDALVPFVTGKEGIALTPTELAKFTLQNKGVDKSLGAQIEMLAEKVKPTLAHLTDQELRAQTIRKAAEIMGVDATTAERALGKIDYDKAALIHLTYYNHLGSDLIDRVAPTVRAMKTLPHDIPDASRLTIIGERTMTTVRRDKLRAAIDAVRAGTGTMREVRDQISHLEDFDFINTGAVAVEKDADLLDVVDNWLKANGHNALTEIPLYEAGALRSDLPDILKQWMTDAENSGYKLALSPTGAPEDLFRITRDGQGRLLNARPWVDFVSEGSPITAPGRLATMKMQVFRQIRSERIVWTNHRRFVRGIVANHGVSEDVANRMFRTIMYSANERGIAPRGMNIHEIMDAARKAITDEAKTAPHGALGDLTERTLARELLVAFRGDFSQVGITQAFTGLMKTRAPGAGGNFWGQLAEKAYPMLKFTLSPWFMVQEYVEPYILNRMRGVNTPLRVSSPGFKHALATRDAFAQFLRSDMGQDGAMMEMAEYQNMLAGVASEVHKRFSTNFLSDLTDEVWGNIGLRKEAAAALLTKRLFGQRMREAFTQIRGEEYWSDLVRHYGTSDSGEVAMRWMAENYGLRDANGERIANVVDMLNPVNIGKQTRIVPKGKTGVTFDTVAKYLGRGDEAGDAMVKALKDTHLDAMGVKPLEAGAERLTRDEFFRLTDNAAVPKEFAQHAYDMATGPEVDEFWTGYKSAFMKRTVKGPKAKADEAEMARALVQVRAATMGLTEEQFIKSHFALAPFRDAATEAAVRADPGRLLEARAGLTRIIQSGMTDEHRALLDMGAQPSVESAVKSRLGSMLRGQADSEGKAFVAPTEVVGSEPSRIVQDLPPDVADENYLVHVASTQPERVQALIDSGTLSKGEANSAQRALDNAKALSGRARHEFTAVGDDGVERSFYTGSITPEDHMRMTLDWMPEEEGLAAKRWYSDLRQHMRDIFGDSADDVLRMFAVSQASDSPVNGLRMVLRGLEDAFVNGLRRSTRKVPGDTREFVGAALREGSTQQLNAENINRAMLGANISREFAAKLNDFLDSVVGNATRRWTGRIEGIGPVAVDRHTARDIGFLDSKAISRLADLPTTRWHDGVATILDRNEGVVMHVKPVGGRANAKDWHLVDEAGNFIDREGNLVDKPVSAVDFATAPNDYQYEWGSDFINKATDLYNQNAVFGRTDWRPEEVQAVGWMRVQKTIGGQQESPMDMFRRNMQVVASEVSGERGSSWAKASMMMQDPTMDLATKRRITRRVDTVVTQTIRDLFGITPVDTYNWAGPSRWAGEKGASWTTSAPAVLLASPESGDDVADILSYANRQREVWNPHYVPATTVSKNPGLYDTVVDIAHPGGKSMDEMEADLNRIAEALNPPGSTMFRDVNGNLVLRIIDRPYGGDAHFFERIAKGKDRGQLVEDTFHAKVAAAYREAGIEADPAIAGSAWEPQVWHSQTYIAGPKFEAGVVDRLNELLGPDGLIQKAYDAGDQTLRETLQREAEGLSAKEKAAWEAHLGDTVSSIRSRGRDVDEGTIRRIGDAATAEFNAALREANPDQYSSLLGSSDNLLREQRTGAVLGYTKRLDEHRSIIAGLRNADPVTGLHELTHVFAGDLDESARRIVIDARASVIDAQRGTLGAKIADWTARRDAASSATTKRKYANLINAAQHDLGALADDVEWSTRHEEWFVSEFQKWLKGGRAPNERLTPVFDHFRNWLQSVWNTVRGQAATPGDEVHPAMEKLFTDMFAGRPPAATVNFDLDQHVLRSAAIQQLRMAQDEAFTTQYFKMGRNFFERSLNHPFFGLYPISYMWGKIVPEMFRFLALRPFGLTAPMVGWNALREVSDSVRIQTQTDPAFGAFINDNADLWSTLNSLFPALPNDIPVNAPLWMRRISEQGLANADAAAHGEATKNVDLSKGVLDQGEYIVGPLWSAKQAFQTIASGGDMARNVLGMTQPDPKKEKKRQDALAKAALAAQQQVSGVPSKP